LTFLVFRWVEGRIGGQCDICTLLTLILSNLTYSGTTSAEWAESYTLRGNTTGGIDIVSSSSRIQPKFPPATFSGDTGKYIWAKLTAQLKEFAAGVDLDVIGSELQKTFNGLWTGSDDHVVKNVVFNHDGDLVLESERRVAPIVVGNIGSQNGYVNGSAQSMSL
jgi:hypothetical protein